MSGKPEVERLVRHLFSRASDPDTQRCTLVHESDMPK